MKWRTTSIFHLSNAKYHQNTIILYMMAHYYDTGLINTTGDGITTSDEVAEIGMVMVTNSLILLWKIYMHQLSNHFWM